MRNFLNTTFKFLSRSITIATILLFTFQFAYAAPKITEFKSTTLEAIPNGNWTLSWKATGAAGCKLVTSDCGGTGSACGAGFYNPNSQVKLDDNGIDTYTYTLKCYSKIDEVFSPDPDSINPTPIYSKKYTVDSPVPQKVDGPISGGLTLSGRDQEAESSPIIVKVIATDAVECGTELCTQMCTVYGETTASCQTCKTDAEKCKTFAKKCLTDDGEKPEGQSSEDQNTCTTSDIDQAEEQGGIDKTPVPPQECSLFGSWGQCAIDAGIYLIDNLVLPLFTGFLRLSSMIFEVSVYIGIVKFSDLIGTGPDSWITSIWRTIRDILNIGVIFVLLYAAINVIVGRGGEIKKLIAGVILFGVMTNFSLFLTKAAIDVSNVIALEFYNQMRIEESIHTVAFDRGIGATVVEVTGLVKFYTEPNDTTGEGGGISQEILAKNNYLGTSFLFRFTMIIVFIAVGFVFLQAAGIFIARTVSLIFLLIFSPLMFAGGIFAPLQKWISRWHEEFLGQTILAPIFFILLYVALTILGNVVTALNDQLNAINKGGGDFFLSTALILISSVLVIFSFSLVINKTKEYAGSIGGKAAQFGNKLGGFALGGAGKIALGGAASGLRSGANLLGAKNLANWAENSNSFLGSAARVLQVDKLKNATFDVRNTTVGKKLGTGVSAALGAAGVDVSGVKLGEGSKTTLDTQKTIPETYKKIKKDFQERADKRGERLVEKKLKDIEEGENDLGIKTDYSAFDRTIKTRDSTGNIQTTQRGLENDEEWEKVIKKSNQQNKSTINRKKDEHLNSDQDLAYNAALARNANSLGIVNPFSTNVRTLEAEYRARQKYKKQFKDSPDTKLKAYTDDLKKPEYANIHGATSNEIDAMSDDDRITLWQTLGREADREIKDIESHLDPDPGTARDEQLERKRKWALLSNKAKNASKQIGELKKKIEDGKEGGKKKKEGDENNT